MSREAPKQGAEAPRVSAVQALLWGLAFAVVIALVVFYFLYGSAARPLLGAAGEFRRVGALSAWQLS